MPVCSQHRTFPYAGYIFDGTQFIDNEVVFPASGTTTIHLSRDIFGTGQYALFDYSASSSATPVQNLSNVVLDISDLILATSYTLVDDPAQNVIVATLFADPNNGTQYIDGTLTISGQTLIWLAPELYATAGTYTLFSYSALVGSISDIVIIPPPGRQVDTTISANGCAISGTTITVTLV
jgi:hypothetical protein